jgi:prevent-host-death family protein
MREVGVLEAKTHFSAIADEVAREGSEVVVTRHGKPLVRIVPIQQHTAQSRREAAERLLALRDQIAERHGIDEDFDWKAARDEGRPGCDS